jgi:putative phosphoesterase
VEFTHARLRLCVISDIHGNVEALRAVLRRIRAVGADRVIVAGDVAAQGPRPAEALDELRALSDAVFVRGNTDRYLAATGFLPPAYWPASEITERLRSLEWTREQLGDERLRFLGALPTEAVVDDCMVVHASPGNDERGIFPDTPLERFDSPVWTALMACGHTHLPLHRRFGDRHVVNAGSVGWPLDGDPRSSFAIVEHDELSSEWRVLFDRVDYDQSAVIGDLETRRVPWRAKVCHFIETATAGASQDPDAADESAGPVMVG